LEGIEATACCFVKNFFCFAVLTGANAHLTVAIGDQVTDAIHTTLEQQSFQTTLQHLRPSVTS